MTDFIYPSSVQLEQIAQTLTPKLTMDRVGFQLFPMVNVDSHLLMWEQKDNFVGLQQVRGLNGEPNRVKPKGSSRFMMEPGIYGEYGLIDEQELTTKRQMASFDRPIDITDLVLDRQNQLLGRRLDRIELIIWTLLTTGTFSVADGAFTLHTDSYTFQSFDSTIGWGTAATSTPLADFRAVQLKARGYSVNFGASATAYMNRVTFNNLLTNTNANDLGGRKAAFGESINGPAGVSRVMAADDMPNVVIYDEGYLDSTGTFQLFIPNNVVVVVGARPAGQRVGEYRFTRNANNPGMAPGAYMKVFDRGEREVPRAIEVHDGHNGGPVIYFPSAIVVMDVS
jgi:hypothetical protein